LLALAKVAAILAFGFVKGAVVDNLAFGVPFNVVANRVWNGRNPKAVGMPAMPTEV
jgi:hypothetical protein